MFKNVIIFFILMCLSIIVRATNTTATLNISGTVLPVLYVGFDATGVTTTNSVSLTSNQLINGFTAVSAGTVYEVTNDASHNYSITIISSNAGKLKHATVNSSVVNYTVNYGTLFTSQSLATPQTTTVNTSTFTALTTTTRAVTINSAGNSNALSGTYSDTVTITATAL